MQSIALNLVTILLLLICLGVMLIYRKDFVPLIVSAAAKKEKVFSGLGQVLDNYMKAVHYICGASINDIKANDSRYLRFDKLKYTYFYEYKWKCCWLLFSYYMCYSSIMVIAARPVDVTAQPVGDLLVSYTYNSNVLGNVLLMTSLVVVNVITDLLSITISFYHLYHIKDFVLSGQYKKVAEYASRDFIAASILFVISQLLSNFYYPLHINETVNNFDWISVKAAMMPYGIIKNTIGDGRALLYSKTYPGQVFLTGTVFLPTIIMALICLILSFIYGISSKIIDLKLSSCNDGISINILPEPIAGFLVEVNPINCRTKITNAVYTFTIGIMSSITATIITWTFLKA